jgi:endonuclease VIII-like 3
MLRLAGCTLNGERLKRAGVVSQLVRAVQGPASSAELEVALRGLQVRGVETLGKELFVFFAPADARMDSDGATEGEVCMRVHFGMSGSLHVNSTHRYAASPCLQMQLCRDFIRVYQSTVCLRSARATHSHIAKLRRLDVCGPFDAAAASSAVLAHGSRRENLLVDALLDQSILPGSGNIIKNEALFLAGWVPCVT